AQGVAPSANGARSEYDNYMLDGTSNTEHFNGNVSTVPPLDSIEEFKLQTANYSAEYGQGGGLVVNIVTKSGSNVLHGSGWEFIRNDDADARNYFSTTQPPFKRNQFGATFGGPIRKDKTFFFFSYEGVRSREGITLAERVPTALERQGDFSQSVGTAPNDPATGLPFAGNVIPQNELDPISQSILAYIPAPNNPSDPLRNYVANPSEPTDNNSWSVRIDHHFSSRDTLFGRFNMNRQNSTIPSGFVNCCDDINQLHGIQGGIGYTHTFSPNAVNQFRFGTNRRLTGDQDIDQGHNVASQLGILDTSSAQEALHFPYISISGFASPAGVSFGLTTLNTFVWNDNFTYVHRNHTINAGAEFSRFRFDDLFGPQAPIAFTFNGTFTGNGLGDFLLGRAQTVGQNYIQPYINTRLTTGEMYVQDDWNVTPKLTLNLGVRYTTQWPVHQRTHQEAFFDPTNGNEIIPQSVDIGGWLGPVERIKGTTILKQDNKVAPRVGLAYRPFGDNKTVVRAAYGIFTVLEQGNAGRQSATNPPFRIIYSASDNINGFGYNTNRPTLADAESGVSGGFFGQFVSGNFRNGYMQSYNFTIEREIAANTVFSIGYVGSQGTHLVREYDENIAEPGAGAVQPRRPYPYYSGVLIITSDDSSNYNSLQTRVEKRYSHGLTFLGSYTFSKALGDQSSLNQFDTQNPRCPRCERGPLWFDARHRFVFSGSYELPFGPGKPLATSGVAGAILGGWAVSGIVTLQTGFPLTVTTIDNANSGNFFNRPDLVGNPNPSNRTINSWIPASAFAENLPDPNYHFGDAGRGIVTGPGLKTVDCSLIRKFRVTERVGLEFHADAFNAFNHPNFGFPDTFLPDATFGVISTAGAPRELQLGLKASF
ncbi:MAG: TonB-dependent receptor, partial [Terriglobales bacterium]